MKRRGMRWLTAGIAGAVVVGVLVAPQATTVLAQSLPDAIEAIDQARVATRILYTTAHPDDETAGLIAYLARGIDADVAMLQITRGQGGQNAIGPEQDGELGVIRTTELLAADQHYGAKQFFTRAVDTGFSKSGEETMKAWGDLPVEDMVRVIRTFRPDVVINGWGGVHFGHGQHQASGIYTPQAVADAADSTKFPDQIAEGLKPWKVGLELRPGSFGFGPEAPSSAPVAGVTFPINDVSPLWGKSYVEMGMEGHAQHRSQGTPSFFGNPFFRRPAVLITEQGQQAGGSFDPKLLAEPITSLAARYPSLQAEMAPALSAADQDLAAAAKQALDLDRAAAADSLAQAGKEIATLREKVASSGGDDSARATWELDRVRERIDAALVKDIALPIDTQADRHELVAGESLGVTVSFLDQSAAPLKWTVDPSSLAVPAGWSVTLAPSKDGKTYQFKVAVPAGAKAPTSPEDAILPFPPPLVALALSADVNGYDFKIRQPVESAVANTTGIDIYPLELVPAVTLTVEPRQVMVPAKKASAGVDLLARVRYHGTTPATVSVGLDAPSGWSVAPIAPLTFTEAGDKLIRYTATPPARTPLGAYPLNPYAKLGDETFRTSLQPIPTLPTRDWSESADATAHVLDLAVPAGLRVGYIAGDNDVVPDSLRQIGIQVDLLDDVALAFGNLSRYDAIIVGIRAYELRPDVMAANPRLLDYVKDGGTLLVQYERDFAWVKLMPAPFKAEIPSQGIRVTNPDSPVDFLAPESPLLNSPNKITMADFQSWVQERGIYFWGTWDPRYRPVIGFTDTGEPEAKGGLVYARDGKGLYIYTGISFFRELPAGVPGAYRLFVNLISQTRHAAAK
ncbi:MAG TPA: PIG-L family deacetylase [Candidatus Aquilonibacter sp.]|nr:PIG-L family deacetylase [Candidatus Aquilonibacter sp.]